MKRYTHKIPKVIWDNMDWLSPIVRKTKAKRAKRAMDKRKGGQPSAESRLCQRSSINK